MEKNGPEGPLIGDRFCLEVEIFDLVEKKMNGLEGRKMVHRNANTFYCK